MSNMEEEDLKLSSSLQRLELEEPKSIVPRADVNVFRPRSKSLSSCTNTVIKAVDKNGCEVLTTLESVNRWPIQYISRYPPVNHSAASLRNFLLRRKSNRERRRAMYERRKIIRHLKDRIHWHRTKFFINERRNCLYENLNLERYDMIHIFNRSSDRTESLLNVDSNKQQIASLCSLNQAKTQNNNATPCDVTIDELASYFETSVHIPKKMSSMAEMMYI